MSDILVYIIVILGVINLLMIVPMTFTLSSVKSILSVSLYYRVWHIENLNILGKILLTVFMTPFTILSELLILLVIILFYAAHYISFRVCWLFAIDRDDTISEWLGDEYIGKKHKLLMYIKECFTDCGSN